MSGGGLYDCQPWALRASSAGSSRGILLSGEMVLRLPIHERCDDVSVHRIVNEVHG
jgi:hypothetical protein